MFSLIKRLTKDHWPLFLLSNISSVVNMLLPIILVRIYSPIDMGIYKTFFLYLSLIPFIVMAGGPLNSVYYWMGKKENVDDYMKATWLVTFVLSSLILIPGLFAVLLFKNSFLLPMPLLIMVLISGFLVCPSGHYNEVCIARGRSILGAGLSVSFELIKTLGFIFIAWKYKNIEYLFTYFFIIMCLSFIFMTYLGWKNNTVSMKWDDSKIKEILSYSMPVSLSSCLMFLTEKADLLIISALVSAETFAYYSLGCLVIPPLYLLENSVQKNMIPKLSAHYHDKKFGDMISDYKKGIQDIAYLIIPAVFGLIVFSKPIIELLYTSRYQESEIYLQVFALGYLLLLIPHDSILRATAKTKVILKIYSYLTPISFLMIYLSAKFLDLKWALVISLVLKGLQKLYCMKISASIVQAKVSEFIPLNMLLQYTIASVALSVVCLLTKNLFITDLSWFMVSAPAFAVLYLSFFILRRS